MSTNVLPPRSYAHLPTTNLDPEELRAALVAIHDEVDDRATVAMAPLFAEEWPHQAEVAAELGPQWMRLPIGSSARGTAPRPFDAVVRFDELEDADDLSPARDGRNLILTGAIGLVALALWLAVICV